MAGKVVGDWDKGMEKLWVHTLETGLGAGGRDRTLGCLSTCWGSPGI